MTHEEIEKLAALEQAATPGEWDVKIDHLDYDSGHHSWVDDVVAQNGKHVVCFGHQAEEYGAMSVEDAQFIVAWRNAAPAIVAELLKGEQLRVEREERGPPSLFEIQQGVMHRALAGKPRPGDEKYI